MKRFLAALMCALVLMCGGASAEGFALDENEEVTLNVVGMLENFEALEAIIADFELEHPNCQIEYEYLNDYNNVLPLRLQNASDSTQLFMATRTNLSDNPELVSYCIDMSAEDSGIDLSAVNVALTESMRFDGALYTVPLAMDVSGMIVNLTLLEAHGLSMPQNFAEFCAACEKLAAEGVTPIRAKCSEIGMRLFYPYIVNSIVHSETAEADIARLNAFEPGTGELLRDSFERLDAIKAACGFEYDEAADFADNYNAAILSFFEGDTAFLPCTSETMSGTRKREARSEAFVAAPFEYEFRFAPVGDDGAYGYLQSWQGLAINQNAEHADWARAFMNFLLRGDNLAKFAETKGLPSNTAVNQGDARYAAVFSLDEAHTAQPLQFQTTVFSCIRNALKSMTTPDEEGKVYDAQGAVELYERLIAEKASAAGK